MLRTILGLRADAPHRRLYVDPSLPAWIPDIELQHMRVGLCKITIRFWREGEASRWEVREITSEQGTKEEEMIEVAQENQ
ncbi:MAG: hypothetical protein NVS3B14_04140 [Ktedonobacteraceae bacterium]